jgi:hypothetical protein
VLILIHTHSFTFFTFTHFESLTHSLKSLLHSLTHSPTHSLHFTSLTSLTLTSLTHTHHTHITHSHSHSLTVHEHTYIHTNSPTITAPSLLYFLFPSCFSMVSLSLKKLVTCGVIRSFNSYDDLRWLGCTTLKCGCDSTLGRQAASFQALGIGSFGSLGICSMSCPPVIRSSDLFPLS